MTSVCNDKRVTALLFTLDRDRCVFVIYQPFSDPFQHHKGKSRSKLAEAQLDL